MELFKLFVQNYLKDRHNYPDMHIHIKMKHNKNHISDFCLAIS